jgi:hypothetical protein
MASDHGHLGRVEVQRVFELHADALQWIEVARLYRIQPVVSTSCVVSEMCLSVGVTFSSGATCYLRPEPLDGATIPPDSPAQQVMRRLEVIS